MGFYFSPAVRKGIYSTASAVNRAYGKRAWNQGKRVISRFPGMKKKKVVKVTPKKTIPRRGYKVLNKVGAQWTQTKTNVNISRPLTNTQRALKLVKATKQQTIYRYQALKDFDNNGYFYMTHYVDGNNNTTLPLYTFDITSAINSDTSGGTIIRSKPMSSAYVDTTGDIYFQARAGVKADGTTQSDELQIERATQGDLTMYPNSQDILKWVNVKLALWGCKSRSTRYKLMLVRFKDDRIIPFHEQLPSSQRNEFFQALLKPYVFNPIATTQNSFKQKMQILKTQDIQIEDTDTSSTDQDPHVRNVNWFVRLDRICNYVETGTKLTAVNFENEADYGVQQGAQNSCYVQPKSRVFLMIIASNYGRDTSVDSTTSPSFDINVRLCHESLS